MGGIGAMNILITGGAGFIGSHLSERLLADGHGVVCFDNYNGSLDYATRRKNVKGLTKHPNFRLIFGDIRDTGYLDIPFEQEKIDFVFHLAAQAGVRPSVADPVFYYAVNVMGTLNVLQACAKHGVKKMVFASSSSVYGDSDGTPSKENDKTDCPVSPYASSKKAGELLCYAYHKMYGMDITCLRPFTVYGPRQREDMAISLFTRQIDRGEKVVIYGDGSNTRDYTYVSDVVDGLVAAMNIKGYDIFNIGGGNTVSLSDLVTLIEMGLGKKANVEYQPWQTGEVNHTRAGMAKANARLGYSPKVTIQNGIAVYIEWFLKEKGNAV